MIADETILKRTFSSMTGKGDWFKECSTCPEMVVVPAGNFTMGSPDSEKGRWDMHEAQVQVVIAAPFAVGRYAVTFDEGTPASPTAAATATSPPTRAGDAVGGR
jgi:formylglycine-generating enzyme required for sulfatase activity